MEYLEYLNSLPDDVDYIDLTAISLHELPDLSRFHSLLTLYCDNNLLTHLPPLPPTLEMFYCDHNLLIQLPPLPPNLKQLYCEYNQLTSLPLLPESLE